MPPDNAPSLRAFLAPRYWPVWLAFGVLRVLAHLPFRWQMGLGRRLGRLALAVSKKRARIAARNLRLCFPDKTLAERRALVHAHFENLGLSIFEMGMAYYCPRRLLPQITVHGADQLEPHAPGATILLTAHFGALEVGGTWLKSTGLEFDAVYRKDRSPLVTELIRRGRLTSGRQVIEKANIKQMVRSLKQGFPVWYAPDQSYRRKQSALVDFFGVPAMTNTATSALARLGGAAVLGFFVHRNADLSGYDIYISPALTDFPSKDPVADSERINRMFEEAVLRTPAQYFWVHRKFKNRPATLPDAYAGLRDEAL